MPFRPLLHYLRWPFPPASPGIFGLCLGGLLTFSGLQAQVDITGRTTPFDLDQDGVEDFALEHQFIATPTLTGAAIFHRISLRPLGSNSIVASATADPSGATIPSWETLGAGWRGVLQANQRLIGVGDAPNGVELVHNNFNIGGPVPKPGTGELLGGLADGTGNHVVLLALGAGDSARPAWIAFRATAYDTVGLATAGFGYAGGPGTSAVTGQDSLFVPLKLALSGGKAVLSRHPLAEDAANEFVYESRADLRDGAWTVLDPTQPLDTTAAQLFIQWRFR